MNGIQTLKRAMRVKYLTLRDEMPEDARYDKSAAIAAHLYETTAYNACREIFIYNSMGSEADTRGVIDAAVRGGKTVALPAVNQPPDKNMRFIRYTPGDRLIKNKYGIYEPAPDAEKTMRSGVNTLVIVPGAVFAKDGRRIGYGGGYYDKFLFGNIYLISVGVCFDLQLDEGVPEGGNDVRTDLVITESGVFE